MSKTTNTSAASSAIASRATRTKKGAAQAAATPAVTKEVTQAAPVSTPVAEVPAPAKNPGDSLNIAKPLGIKFAMPAIRPASGALLAAHTAVFLKHSGIIKNPVSSKVVREVMGDTAVSYHLRQGNFESVRDERDEAGNVIRKGGLIVTARGLEVFGKRREQGELESAFENVLCFGQLDERTGNKNANLIIPIA